MDWIRFWLTFLGGLIFIYVFGRFVLWGVFAFAEVMGMIEDMIWGML